MTATVTGVSQDAVITDAYRRCGRMQRRHDPTYWWATQRLPREVRPAIRALYGYVRGADEIVDGRECDSSPSQRRAALDAWQAELETGLERGRSEHPVIAALVDAGRRHDLPLHELRPYMESMRTDCGPVRIADRAQLDLYMRGSAAAVGIVVAPLLDAPPAELARMGVAFQLTNFIRDVEKDWALDRIYLPGVQEADLRAGAATPGLRQTVAGEVARARELFASTSAVAGALSPRLRPGIRLARAVYGQVLDRAERLDFDVLARRASLTPLDVGRALAAR